MTTNLTSTQIDEQPAPARTIVVGVDGSPSSLQALSWGVRQAALLDTTVHAVIAWHYPAIYGMYSVSDEIDWAGDARQTIDAAVKEILGDDATLTTSSVVQGNPAQVLLDAGAEAQLIVVGNRGHGGFVGTLLGSVSERVASHATCPVVVVRQPEQT